MKKTSLICLVLATAVSCGDNKKAAVDAAPDMGENVTDDGYQQVEHLARPGINEALLFTTDFNLGYNATAPSFAGVPPATLAAVVKEAKTVLKALYLGVCLLDGVAGLTPSTGLKPAGIQCAAVGDLWTDSTDATSFDGTQLTEAVAAGAQAYADKVFGQFIPDVMRIDTGVDSFYQTLCGDATTAPLLCGGRFLNDDTIDITYDYLLNGAGTPSDGLAVATQQAALVSDGVNFDALAAGTQRKGNRLPPAAVRNDAQGHPAVTDTFPYSADPL